MAQRTWLITGVSSGFGHELTEQLLERGDQVVGTVRDTSKVADLADRNPQQFRAEVLDLTDTQAIHEVATVPCSGPARMAACIIDRRRRGDAPLRMVLGSQALESTLTTLRARSADFEAQRELAASTDFPPGE